MEISPQLLLMKLDKGMDFTNIINATRNVEEKHFRMLRRPDAAEKSEKRAIVDLEGKSLTVPFPIDHLAYNPDSKTYLGITKEGRVWHSAKASLDLQCPIEGPVIALDFFHGRFWCLGSAFQILCSEDGIEWELKLRREYINARHHPGIWTSIVGGYNEEVFAVGLDGIIGIFDGVDWTLERIPDVSFFDAVVIDETTTYACGSNGNLAKRCEEGWELVSTPLDKTFTSFARISNQVYISDESKVYGFKAQKNGVSLNEIALGGKLFASTSCLFMLSDEKTLTTLSN